MDSHERYRSIDWRDSMKLQRCWFQWGEAPAFVMPVFILTFFCARWQDIKIPPFCKHKLTLEKNERGERGLEASNLRKAKKPLTAWRKRAREEREWERGRERLRFFWWLDLHMVSSGQSLSPNLSPSSSTLSLAECMVSAKLSLRLLDRSVYLRAVHARTHAPTTLATSQRTHQGIKKASFSKRGASFFDSGVKNFGQCRQVFKKNMLDPFFMREKRRRRRKGVRDSWPRAEMKIWNLIFVRKIRIFRPKIFLTNKIWSEKRCQLSPLLHPVSLDFQQRFCAKSCLQIWLAAVAWRFEELKGTFSCSWKQARLIRELPGNKYS